ncbi:MAG: RES family NAD+ phosphorylase [Opitutaceae bacterium]
MPRSPLHWSHSPEGRFSHPDNLGVLYLAESAETSFWELFHPNLRDILPRDWRLRDRDLLFRSVWSIDVMAPLWVLDSADGEALRAIGADGSTFTNAYEFTQRWARTLTDHPDGRIQGILYGSVRDPGKRCLALFEGRTRVASLKPKYVARADLHDEVVDVLFRNRIAISPRAAP